jgi:AcrR family transcriptional regulator
MYGFKDASMRNISKEAQVGLSNIYNYFKNKDEIFIAIVNPAKDELFRFITRQHTEENVDFSKASAFGHQEEAIEYYINLIDTYKEEIRLLLFSSQGSSIDNFRDALTDHITQVSYNYLELEKKYYPHANNVSHFFIHAMASWMVSILGEIVTHDLNKKKIREFFREYFRFGFAGWCELTGI